MAYDVQQLLQMTSDQLDQLFTNSRSGQIPDGPAKGTAIIAPGTDFTAGMAEFIELFVWQGKIFDARHGTLINRVFGINAILAEVYFGASLFDDKQCVILDYTKTSAVAHWVRDEIRLIEVAFYLGKVYWDNKPLIHFCLDFDS